MFNIDRIHVGAGSPTSIIQTKNPLNPPRPDIMVNQLYINY